MTALGYPLSLGNGGGPAKKISFAPGQTRLSKIDHSSDGELQEDTDCALVQVRGPDFHIFLPVEPFDAAEVKEILGKSERWGRNIPFVVLAPPGCGFSRKFLHARGLQAGPSLGDAEFSGTYPPGMAGRYHQPAAGLVQQPPATKSRHWKNSLGAPGGLKGKSAAHAVKPRQWLAAKVSGDDGQWIS